ncbi:hypothetical protein PHYPSEUDO_015526 [Phytophthora pseudosyringae]|uniref:N-acetyltransferase domain-containing protein n=1 Tax=Phytophthora pseudosyringae TaxID=221518 RepID=A0A8T1VZZ5_9STRA|nr:hypothetical protein PHYPSEUDO_015526 [Phytophthora pseudosyringae]
MAFWSRLARKVWCLKEKQVAEPPEVLARCYVAEPACLIMVGDEPMGVARCRPASEESGRPVATIEHFGVVESKRRQGYAKRFLRALVEDMGLLRALLRGCERRGR